MSSSGVASRNYLGYFMALLNILPPQYLYLSTIFVILIAVLLLFKGSTAWNILMICIGAYYGFVFALYISTIVNFGGLPIYLIFMIAAVIGAILFKAAARIGLSAFFAFIAFILVSSLYPGNISMEILAAIVAFGASYVLYKKVTTLLSAILGSFLLWFALITLGLGSVISQIVAGILMVGGLYLQITEKKRSRKEDNRRGGISGGKSVYKVTRKDGTKYIIIEDDQGIDFA
ncbi:MAG: hypothetical protein AAE977_00460 [Thermoplasmataceae archaeon]|jgi:hypothetical protein